MFENENVFITGAAGGIGKAISMAFAKEGAKIALTDLDEKGLEESFKELKSKKTVIKTYLLDVTKEKMVKVVVSKVLEDFPCIDILVNNAGVSTMNWFWELTEEEWDFNMNVNVKGVWLVTKHIVPHMIERKKGKIVNIASMAAKMGAPLLTHYSASKFAVVGFTQSIAKELAPYRINVNSVCPGFVKTSMQEREIAWEAKLQNIKEPEKVREEYIKQTPLGRLCYPEDVAKTVLFLSSDNADFMTGQAINVTGGACMH
ncbi:MAG: SDR family oxidoreductase [Candidatus Atribacteria bacterium]|jgi:NAD(P)-dependent dehydrogenase (short-subunit alcohol dehydrogenase family)|nr:SDR family oxidoreductase [Candidatus Atribacteria bacterium]